MSVIQENVRTCDLLCAKALLSGFHTFRASMCWLALVAEMLLLEAALVKSKLGGYAGKKADWIGLGSRVLIGV